MEYIFFSSVIIAVVLFCIIWLLAKRKGKPNAVRESIITPPINNQISNSFTTPLSNRIESKYVKVMVQILRNFLSKPRKPSATLCVDGVSCLCMKLKVRIY